MVREPRAIPVTGLVILAAFAAGYLLPSLADDQPRGVPPVAVDASPVVDDGAVLAPTPPTRPGAPQAPTPSATTAAVATATVGPALATPSSTPTPTGHLATSSPSPTPTPRVHVVQPGDNLWDLSQRYGVTVEALVEANKLSSPESLRVGEKLVVPPPEP